MEKSFLFIIKYKSNIFYGNLFLPLEKKKKKNGVNKLPYVSASQLVNNTKQ